MYWDKSVVWRVFFGFFVFKTIICQKCIKWGNTFDVSLESRNVHRQCTFRDAKPICCAAVLNETSPYFESRGVGVSYVPYPIKSVRSKEPKLACMITKKYVSSPLEIRDLEMAKNIERSFSSDNIDGRLEALLTYVTSEETIANSTKWLERVRLHMLSEDAPEHTLDDSEFLSRFIYTRDCGGEIDEWTEWIEPISITARHPFGFSKCKNTGRYFTREKPRVGRSDVDYVLLQSGRALYNQTHTASGRKIAVTAGEKVAKRGHVAKHYLLDAGTSTFDSSLFWFTCGYSQRKISFDQVFAWEMTLLEPNDYWQRVPPLWKPFWHFYNVPIAADSAQPDSPVRFLKQMATSGDFVAFKLDIDHPAMEMPLALSLLSDPSLAALVDEFFFELHFQCEVMTSCGWGKRVPAESHGLVLDRSHVLQFFIDLRSKRGIRAHIWP